MSIWKALPFPKDVELAFDKGIAAAHEDRASPDPNKLYCYAIQGEVVLDWGIKLGDFEHNFQIKEAKTEIVLAVHATDDWFTIRQGKYEYAFVAADTLLEHGIKPYRPRQEELEWGLYKEIPKGMH